MSWPTKRWFQFSMRTLLLLPVGFACVFALWPLWQRYRAVQSLTTAIKQKADVNLYGLVQVVQDVHAERRATAKLILLLSNRDPEVQRGAAAAIQRMGPAAEDALSALIECVRTEPEDEGVIAYAAATLGNFGPKAEPAIPALVEFVGKYPWRIAEASWSLAQIGEKAVPALIEALASENPGVRDLAAMTLGSMGESGRVAVPELTNALEDQDVHVRVRAACALWQLDAPLEKPVHVLLDALTDDQRGVAEHALNVLAHIGPKAAPFAESLKALSINEDDRISTLASKALQRVAAGGTEESKSP